MAEHRPRATRPRLRSGLRMKLLWASLMLIFIPLLVVWSIGIYERVVRGHTEERVRWIAATLVKELSRRGVTAARLSTESAWLRRFASRHHVMIRVIGPDATVTLQTHPLDAERWSSIQKGWFRSVGDFFFGPTGPPDLIAYEASLPAISSRPEVRQAIAGGRGEIWRSACDNTLSVFYFALPLPKGDGAIYLSRLSRRSIRALYELRYQLLKLTLYLTIVAALLGLWIGWRIVNPIVRIQQIIRSFLENPAEIQPGQLCLDRRDEIGALSRDLQQLTSTMQRQVTQATEVAADIAHDMKNPIAAVIASAEMMEGAPQIDPQRQRRLAGAIRQAAEHLSRSVEGMLQLARLERNLASTRRAPVNMSRIIAGLLASCAGNPALQRVTFESAIEEDLRVFGLEDELARLAQNLLDNAVVFCAERVQVSLRRADAEVILTISDDGPGVSAGNRDKIFQRFFSKRPEGAPAGTGLGLAIAKTITVSLGGQIAYEPDGPLSGASLVVRLPAST